MNTKGLASWLPPTRAHACLFGMGIGCAIGLVCAFFMGVGGCAAKAEPAAGAAKASTYEIQYGRRVDLGTQCAPLPEVVP